MDRKQFFKSACGFGICSCIGAGLIPAEDIRANEKDNNTDWKDGFVKYRFAKLIGILDSTLDEKTKNQIIENLGKECAKNSFAGQFKNNVEGFFEEIHKRWGEQATYNKEKGLIRIETPERDCVCPLVKQKYFQINLSMLGRMANANVYNNFRERSQSQMFGICCSRQ